MPAFDDKFVEQSVIFLHVLPSSFTDDPTIKGYISHQCAAETVHSCGVETYGS